MLPGGRGGEEAESVDRSKLRSQCICHYSLGEQWGTLGGIGRQGALRGCERTGLRAHTRQLKQEGNITRMLNGVERVVRGWGSIMRECGRNEAIVWLTGCRGLDGK